MHPINAEFRSYVESTIIAAYEEALAQAALEEATAEMPATEGND